MSHGLEQRFVVLNTRKKQGGHLTPRQVVVTTRLHEALSRRHGERQESNPWVFRHTYFDHAGNQVTGP